MVQVCDNIVACATSLKGGRIMSQVEEVSETARFPLFTQKKQYICVNAGGDLV